MKASSYLREFIPKTWIALREGYSWKFFRGDLIAGVTVGIVSLPLAMAFAIASGVPPVRGLYTAIIAGFLISLLGGSRQQIGGPTGAFVVIIYSIIERNGYDGLAMATLMAGVFLLIAAFLRIGSLIKYIPYPLITGFTTGLALVIFSSQIKDFLGLSIPSLPVHFWPKCVALFSHLGTFHPATCALASATLMVIILLRKYFPAIPWGISAIVLATLVSHALNLPVETIQDRFGQIPRNFPYPALPNLSLLLSNFQHLLPDAMAIAFLAGVESLLSAVVADGLSGRRHKSNCELMAQGIGNIGSIFFGGIPATGAIARTAINVKSGAKTPLAGMIHAITLLLILYYFAPIVSHIPLAALSSVLIMVAWNMSEIGHFKHLFKAPKEDVLILLTTFSLTVLVDLIVAIEVGMVLSAFLFMKRMHTLSRIAPLARAKEGEDLIEPGILTRAHIPAGVEVYEITGHFFFGLADTLKSILSNLERPPLVFILRMHKIDFIDASGMHALREFYSKCHKEGTTLLLAGVRPSVLSLLTRFGLTSLIGNHRIFSTMDKALASLPTFTNPLAEKS